MLDFILSKLYLYKWKLWYNLYKGGYQLLEEDEDSDEKLNSYPSSILIDGVYGSYVLDCYRCNKYEEEDEYFAFDDVT